MGRLAAVLLLAGCGGSASEDCWHYDLTDAGGLVGSGTLEIGGNAGTFTLATTLPVSASSGLVFVSREPNGNLVLQLYESPPLSRLILDVQCASATEPLAGTATSHALSRTFTFRATRC